MKFRQTILICRFLTLILLSNIMVPVVFANIASESGYAILCTSAGLVKVQLDNADTEVNQGDNSERKNHCLACQLFDHSNLAIHSLANHLVPELSVLSSYRSLDTSRATQYIVKHNQSRAPPFSS